MVGSIGKILNPDSHLFADAETLRQTHEPDFMLVHPMSIDYTGHCFGSDTKEYRGSALAMDSLLSHYVPRWREAGYTCSSPPIMA